jgi:hypothetical protein
VSAGGLWPAGEALAKMIISGAGCRIRSVGMVSAVSLMYQHSGLFSPRNTS